MQKRMKSTGAGVTSDVLWTCELHSKEPLSRTMSFSEGFARSANDINAVSSFPLHLFVCHSTCTQLTQVSSWKELVNAINSKISPNLHHSQCHSQPLPELRDRPTAC